jgi:hypothetical protein
MKEMAYRTKVHKTDEILHQIMDAAVYIWEHLDNIQCAVNSFGRSKAVHWKLANILKSYMIYLSR